MHRALLILALLVAVVLAGAAEVYTQDSTPDEQSYVERLVQRLVSSPGRPVAVQGIGISLSGDVTAERIAVRDTSGEWLVIENFVLDWSPLSLFTSRLRIDALTAGRMTVLRRPEAAPQADAPEEAAGLTAADIDRLNIDELILEAPVVGAPARLRVRGSGAIAQSPPAISFDLSATRIDDIDGQLVANILYQQGTGELTLDLVLAEQSGGLVQSLLALEDDPMVDLRVVGSGPLDNWSGDLRLALNGQAVVTGTASVAGVAGGTMIETRLDGDFTAVAPTALDPLFPGRSELAAAVMLDDAGALRIESAVLRSEAADVIVDGLIDFAAADLLLSLTGQLAYAEPVELDAGVVDKLAFEARLNGPFDAPEWAFNATAEAIIAAGLAGRDLTLEIAGTGLPLDDRQAEARVIASGLLEPAGRTLPPLLAGRFLADLVLDLPGDGRIVLEAGHLQTPSAAVDATGFFAPSDGRYDLAVDAQAHSPETGHAVLDGLFEGRTRLAGRVSGTGPGAITLHDVTLTSDVLDGRVSGRVSDDGIEVTATAAISDIARLDARARGAVEIEASLVGPRDAPRVEIAGRGREVHLMGKPFSDVAFEASGILDAAAPSLDVSLTGELDRRPVAITASLGAADDGSQDVTLAATIGTARIDGALTLAPEAAPRGRLVVAAPDLSHLGPLLLAELGGSLDAEIALADDAGQSTAVVTAQGRNISYGGLSAASLDADVTVEDLFGTPRPAGQARLRQLSAGGFELATVDLDAAPVAPGSFAVSLNASGPRLGFTARTRTTVEDGVFLVRAETLSGAFEGIDMELVAPAAIRIDGDDIGIDRAEIAVGSGRLIVAGSLGPQLAATIEARDLPLTAAAQAVPDLAPAGTVSGTATLSGSLEAPQARFTVSGRDIAVAALRDYGLPPVAVEAEGEYADERLTFNATARGADATELAVAGTVSTVAPVRVDVAVRGPVSSSLVADRLAEAGLRLDARLDLDLRITGQADDLAVTGTVTTSDATVGDLDGRFIVQQASGRIVLGDDFVRIERLEGTTGRNGRAAISGDVALSAPHQADLRIDVERGQYNDGTLLVTTFDAQLTLTGPLTGTPRLAGRVDLIGPKLTLNEPPPVALAPLEVMHVNAPPAVRRQVASLVARRGGGGGDMLLDIELVVRDRFTVRGRGLNAELIGRLRLTGSVSDLRAAGGFRLQRGHMNLLGRRFEIASGQLDFTGNLDPRITFIATAFRDGVSIELTVAGRATAPEITVASSPPLPQEEALARLIFGTSLTQLSPFQIAQLAAAVATLSGGGGGGLFDGIGNALGLDRFEVFENEAGETTVAVGRRVHERVSLGVEQGREPGSTRVNIDIDLTRTLKARGSLGRDGSTKAGVFFQTDY